MTIQLANIDPKDAQSHRGFVCYVTFGNFQDAVQYIQQCCKILDKDRGQEWDYVPYSGSNLTNGKVYLKSQSLHTLILLSLPANCKGPVALEA